MKTLSYYISICVLLLIGAPNLSAQEMNNDNLGKIIYVVSDTMRGANGMWEFVVGEMTFMCMTDEYNDRMRIIAPVKEVSEVTPEELQKAMEANFHSALDVRYAVAEGVMWVAYIHPLKQLNKTQVIDAISQVYSATINYGTTYSSTDLVFPKSEEREEQEKNSKKKKKKKS